MPGRDVPTAPESEHSLLGAALLDPHGIDESDLGRIPVEAFYRERHRMVWRHILALHERGEMIDSVTLIESLRSSGELDQAGGAEFIVGLMDYGGVGTFVNQYANQVLEAYNKRKLMEAAHKTIVEARNGRSFGEVLDEAEARLYSLRTDERHSIRGALQEAEKYATGRARVTTGFPSMDRAFGGFPAGDLTVIAARLSMGKSGLVHSIIRRRGSAHLLSPDQPLPEILATFASQDARVPLERLNNGEATTAQAEAFRKALRGVESELESKDITMDDSSLNFARMVREVRRAARAEKELVVIDHAQNISGDKASMQRRELMIEIVGALKDLAREYGIAVVLMSQLSREVESRPGHVPMLSDLSESKSIEEAANLVLFLHRDKYYDPNPPKGDVADIIVAKNKTGRRNKQCQLVFHDSFAQFKEVME